MVQMRISTVSNLSSAAIAMQTTPMHADILLPGTRDALPLEVLLSGAVCGKALVVERLLQVRKMNLVGMCRGTRRIPCILFRFSSVFTYFIEPSGGFSCL
jgi:hypothetical protein